MIPQLLDPFDDVEAICFTADHWQIAPELAAGLYTMAQLLPFGISIISGYRTREEQLELDEEGRPTAPDELSTHRSCPATGVDLRPDVEPTDAVKATFGRAATRAGLRWGGGSRADARGIPFDWNHVDLGPRHG